VPERESVDSFVYGSSGVTQHHDGSAELWKPLSLKGLSHIDDVTFGHAFREDHGVLAAALQSDTSQALSRIITGLINFTVARRNIPRSV
jgi:hypothetical protein